MSRSSEYPNLSEGEVRAIMDELGGLVPNIDPSSGGWHGHERGPISILIDGREIEYRQLHGLAIRFNTTDVRADFTDRNSAEITIGWSYPYPDD